MRRSSTGSDFPSLSLPAAPGPLGSESGPVIREPRAGFQRPAGVAEVDAHAQRGKRVSLRPGRLPHDLPKAVVLPVLDDFPAVSRVARHDVADRPLMIGKRPKRARRGRRAEKATPFL